MIYINFAFVNVFKKMRQLLCFKYLFKKILLKKVLLIVIQK